MAAKIPPPNYTQLPNVILDNLRHLSDAELRVVVSIARQTFGWHREKAKMSISFIAKAGGLSGQGAINAIQSLIKREIVGRTPDGDGFLYFLLLNDVDSPLPTSLTTPSQHGLQAPPTHVDTPPPNGVDTKKERGEIKKRKDAPQPPPGEPSGEAKTSMVKIPESLDTPKFAESWAEWEKHRREKRQKLTPTSISRQLAKLAKIGVDRAVVAISHSIEQGYTGIYEPKGGERPNTKRDAVVVAAGGVEDFSK